MADPMSTERLTEILWTGRKRALGYDTMPRLGDMPASTREQWKQFAEEVGKQLDQDESQSWHDAYQDAMNAHDAFMTELLELLPGATDTGADALDQIPRAIEKLRAGLAAAERNAEQSRATAHGLGRDYRQARAQLESKRDLLRLAEESARDAQQELERTDQRAETAEAERDRLAGQVKRVRARHYGQCGGVCATVPCECEPSDLLCDECETPYPCPTVLDLDRTEPTSAAERDGGNA